MDPRFPIGKFSYDADVPPVRRDRSVAELAALPAELRSMLAGTTDGDLERTYRPGGWTVRQVVHHLADSHLNGYTRFKLALTEDIPTIKPYDEERWAVLRDVVVTPVEVSLDLLAALHVRWVALVQSLAPAELARSYLHPELGRALSLDLALASYAWHGRHHTAHVAVALGRRHGEP
jgi:hypothetical protein